MHYLVLGGISLIEVAALLNRGGGPLASHFILTAITGVIFVSFIYFLWTGRIQFVLDKKRAFLYGTYAIFYITFLISFLFSKTPQFGVAELLLFGNAGVLFVILTQTKFEEKTLEWFKMVIVGFAALEVLWGSFIYIQNSFPRFAGTFLDLAQPYTSFGNDFANFLIIPGFAAWGFLLKKYSRKSTSILVTIITALICTAFILSFSRAAWLSVLCASLLVTVWVSVFRKHIRSDSQWAPYPHIILRVTCVLLLTTALISGLQSARRTQQFEVTDVIKKLTFSADEGTASISERKLFWVGALQLIKENPLTGTGAQSFKYMYPKHQPVFGITWDHPHNLLLKVGVENGVLAAMAIAAFFLLCVIFIFQFLVIHPTHQVSLIMFGALAVLAHNLLDYNFIVSNFVLLITVLGISFSFARTDVAHENERVKKPIFVLFILGVFVAIFSYVTLHEALYSYYFKQGRAALDSGETTRAIELLEKSQKLFFPRDSEDFLAVAYRKAGERDKEKLLLESPQNLVDAAAISRLADIYEEEKNFGGAYEYAMRALTLDPQNRLKYYYQVLSIAKGNPEVAKEEEVEEIKNQLTPILEDYALALMSNRHNTVITDNPDFAYKLYELLGDTKNRDMIFGLWLTEYMKFVNKYGAPKESINF